MEPTKTQILDALRRVKGPDLDGNIVDQGLVSEIVIKDRRIYFSITVAAERARELEPLRQAAEKVVAAVKGVEAVTAVLTADSRQPARPEHARVTAARQGSGGNAAPRPASGGTARGQPIPGVRHLIAVASGKGGVGKSTTAVNLALGLKALGLEVGLLDADVYGPSQPRLLGLSGRPRTGADRKLLPMQAYGLRAMSMGFMVDEGTPVIWRGPMVVSALGQMLREVAWTARPDGSTPAGAALDAIVIDMPPGTGDVQLSIAQQAPLSGAVIVSTPQDLALIDARKGLNMFRQVDVPVLGIIENMSYFVCPKCGETSHIFGHGGAEHEAVSLGVPFLGAVPLHIEIRETSDAGQPVVATRPESVHAGVYREIAGRVWAGLATAEATRAAQPRLAVEAGGAVLGVTFPDGRHEHLSAEMLRVMSPSAEVQGHSPSQRVTVGGKRHVRIRDLSAVGTYAVRIAFDDGHDTGLYAWSYLERLARERDSLWAAYEAELAAKGLTRG